MRGFGYALSSFGDLSARVGAVRRQEVSPGDSIIVRTQNSVYALRLGDDGAFSVSGGWFRRKGRENIRMTVTGCSLGGTMIRIDTIDIASTKTNMIAMPKKIFDAADGLRLSALITAEPRTDMTTDGPITAMNMTMRMMNVSASIIALFRLRRRRRGLFLFDHDRAFIRKEPDDAALN